mmetsp:Transcript_23030/g.64710  ORF Transcript_23030/g.64710 Transcript_23030/m.64710 type:complete len:104 (+) Transcript_23030:3-314(+)
MQAFATHFPRAPAANRTAFVRAMLYYCVGANACNSGLGVGYFPFWPASDLSVPPHFTGSEFILQNLPLYALDSYTLQLPAITLDQSREARSAALASLPHRFTY